MAEPFDTNHDPRDDVQEFIDKFAAPRDPAFWLKLMDEEAEEVVDAFAHLLKELADFLYVTSGYACNTDDEPEAPAKWNLVAKLSFAIIEEMPEVFQAVFKEVHRSNLSKLGDDGEPIRREDGKILKGPNYSPADIRSIVDFHLVNDGVGSTN